MSLSVDTCYGKVIVSNPYYSFILWGEVVSVTLFKPENWPNGYGVCKEFVASRKKKIHTRRFLEEFAKQAAAIF